jgi:Mg2+ and Co2+ transporter CorA
MMILTDLPQHVYIFAVILAVLLLSFVTFSLIPSFAVSRQLSAVIKKLILLNGKPDDSLAAIFSNKGVLDHLWQEYADSLHKQTEGLSIRLRSTMPAGVVFRPDILVDIPLRADFFKHLPGLFTGVGIIGTFYGLLIGMKSFVVSDNSIVVRESLTRLLHGVSEAFLISASAISLAMIVTFIEKLVASRLNAKVEKLVQLLDGLFEGGAGEEYLARLVQATESSSVQAAGLLKGELKQILDELIDKQIVAMNAGSAALGERISASIEEGMKAPLTAINDSLKNKQSDQGAALQTMLKAVLDDFSGQMKSLFGGQGSLQQQTIAALEATVVKLESMAAGPGSMDALVAQIAKSSAAAESREALMLEKLVEFVEQMSLAASQTQTDGQAQLQGALNEMSARMGSVVDSLSAQVLSATDVSRRHQQEMESQSQNAVGQLSDQIALMIEGVSQSVAQINSAVAVMHATTTEAMSAFNTSAETLHLASRDFAQAGQSVSATLDKSALVADQLVQAAGSVVAASSGLGEMFGDYKAAREAMVEQVRSLQLLAEQVRRDASMSGEVLARIESATGKLIAAQKDADDYLSRISDVIAVAHQSFSEGMTRAVGEANREFHLALSDSVKLLREGIHELESTLDAATSI